MESLRCAREARSGTTKATVDCLMSSFTVHMTGSLGGSGDMVLVLEDALAAVADCRTALAWSYVEGYYITNDTKRTLFNHMQSELEKHTDHLQARAPLGHSACLYVCLACVFACVSLRTCG